MKTKEELKKEFDSFIAKYDLNEYRIMKKYHHSFRVADICEYLAIKMRDEYNLSNEDMQIAYLIGLLHDIARFEQFTRFHSYIDSKTVDHGDLGKEILEKGLLRNYITKTDYDCIILYSVESHNKFEIENAEKYTDKEIFFMKLIRDADKLDIFYQMVENIISLSNIIYSNNFTPLVLENFKAGYMTPFKDEKTDDDKFIRIISFVHDISYKESFKYLYEKDYINKLVSKLQIKDEARNTYNELLKITNEYIINKMYN